MCKKTISLWLKATRPQFFPLVMLPIGLGTMIAWQQTARVHMHYAVLFLLAGILSQAAANVVNDYFDHLSQTDEFNQHPLTPFAGGSRMIQRGQLSARATYCYGLMLLALAVFIGLYLIWARGFMLLGIGLIGIVSAFFYSAPPLAFSHRGLGELVVGFNFGILAPLGAYYMQTGTITLEVLIAALPLACLAAAILIINEFPDVLADQQAGKRTLVVRMGPARARFLYSFLILLNFFILIAGVLYAYLPLCTVFSVFALPRAKFAIQNLFKHYQHPWALRPAIKTTISLHITLNALLILSFLVASRKAQLLSLLNINLT